MLKIMLALKAQAYPVMAYSERLAKLVKTNPAIAWLVELGATALIKQKQQRNKLFKEIQQQNWKYNHQTNELQNKSKKRNKLFKEIQ